MPRPRASRVAASPRGRSARSRRRPPVVGRLREEPRLLALEEELEPPGRAVAVLRDGAIDKPRRAGRRLLAVAPQHDHDVSVLLERSTLPKGRELRLAAGIARGAGQLRESDHDDAELARERLQVPRDRRDLLHAVLVVLAGT